MLPFLWCCVKSDNPSAVEIGEFSYPIKDVIGYYFEYSAGYWFSNFNFFGRDVSLWGRKERVRMNAKSCRHEGQKAGPRGRFLMAGFARLSRA